MRFSDEQSDGSSAASTASVGADGEAAPKEILRRLRHFHLGDPAALAQTGPPAPGLLPAQLHAFRDFSLVRNE